MTAKKNGKVPAETEIGAGVSVSRGVKKMVVKVNPDVTITNDGKYYKEGEEVTLEGPDAIALTQQGACEIVRSVND